MTQLKSVCVSRTLEYSPEGYLNLCERNNKEPTQEGFIDYVSRECEWDFTKSLGQQTINVMDY